MITPKEIHDKEFKRSVRGYDMDDVDRFLDIIIKDLEELYKENATLKEEEEILRKKVDNYTEIEASLNRALVSAEKAADNTIKEAMAEKDRIINEATVKAVLILDKAKEDAKSFNTVNQELIEKSDKFKDNLIKLFEEQISSIKESGKIEENIKFAQEIKVRLEEENEKEVVKEVEKEKDPEVLSEPALEETLVASASPVEEKAHDFTADYQEDYDIGLFDEEEEEFKNRVFKFLEK